MHYLPLSFYKQSATKVAEQVLGMYLVRTAGTDTLIGKITETEAYLGGEDPASHAFKGKTKRNAAMFLEGGHAYVYFIYGNHYCLNIVTGKSGKGEAVLIRALDPISGIDHMRRNRPQIDDRNLMNGPGKLCQALHITKEHNGSILDGSKGLGVVKPDTIERLQIKRSTRIGIKKGTSLVLRYFIHQEKKQLKIN